MRIASGVDIVYLPRFQKSLKNGGQNFLERVFHETELAHLGGGMQHLAGIFAAKEAIMKALGLDSGSWLDIRIDYKKNGVPKAQIYNLQITIDNYSLSISHDGSYVIAQFVGILKR